MDSLMFLVHLTLLSLFSWCSASKEFSLARFNTTSFANNSTININLVGEGYPGFEQTDGGALECHTDDTTCCSGRDNPNVIGEWYYPNGTVVPRPGGGLFYRTRDHMVLRLNRVGNINTLSSTGVYRCVIPGAGGVTITRYITLVNGVTCSDLSDVTNGEVTYTPPRSVSSELPDGQRYTGTIATYSCSSGYQLVGGSSLRACGPDVTWNGTVQSCNISSVAGDSTSVPGDDSTSVPGDDSTSVPGDDSTSVPGDDSTSVPGDDSTSVPGDDSTSVPGGVVIGAVATVVFVLLLIIVVVLTGVIIWRVSRKRKLIETSAVCVQVRDVQPEQEAKIHKQGKGQSSFDVNGSHDNACFEGHYSVIQETKAPPTVDIQTSADDKDLFEGIYSAIQETKVPPIPELHGDPCSQPPPAQDIEETADLYSVVDNVKKSPIREFKGGSSSSPEQQGPGKDEIARLEGLYSVVNKKKAPLVSSPPPEKQGTEADELAHLEGLYSVVNKKKAPPVPGYQGDDEMVCLESLYSVVQKEKR